MKTLAILGAQDPEMNRIALLLEGAKVRISHATADGRRVHAGNAYQATGYTMAVASSDDAEWTPDRVLMIECGWAPQHGLDGCGNRIVIDHHRPGDPGYGQPASQYLEASSIGQVIRFLGEADLLPAGWYQLPLFPGDLGRPGRIFMPYEPPGADDPDAWIVAPGGMRRIPLDILWIAAADHCLGAAYQGHCPGVDPDALMRWRIQERAKFQQRSEGEVLADVERARAALREKLLLQCDYCGNVNCGQMYGSTICEPELGYRANIGPWLPGPLADFGDSTVPELPEAAAREGIAFLATVIDPDGRRKRLLQVATPNVVSAWMTWAQEHLTGVYGDPARGFAGGYMLAARQDV